MATRNKSLKKTRGLNINAPVGTTVRFTVKALPKARKKKSGMKSLAPHISTAPRCSGIEQGEV